MISFVSVTVILLEIPGSPQILTISAFIIASPDPSCSEDEIASLEDLDAQVDAGLEELNSQLEEFESALEGNEDREVYLKFDNSRIKITFQKILLNLLFSCKATLVLS